LISNIKNDRMEKLLLEFLEEAELKIF
jgi:hypothetical protein